ncbi:MAG: ADP-ribosyl-[dinitrogen reductase] hydrolase [Deltaproteobacteria bacterium]|nr:ADP-ribosyl-[dinitrogen reductase] hydrolase [Deltaproteobacteria bacterium]
MSAPPSPPDVLGRARACLLGLALGDALGATTEFMSPAEIRAAHGVHRTIVGGGWLGLRPGRVTDDTEMSLALARALVAAGGWDLTAVAEGFVAWLKGRPIDVGATCRKGIRDYLLTGRLEVPPNEWDAGNGAAVRVAPVALFGLGDEELCRGLAVAQARLTHHHPLSDAACGTVALLVQRAVLGATAFDLHAVTRDLAARHPAFGFARYQGEASGYVVDTLRTVFHHFFTTATFEECLVAVVNQGGDADTTGAIAGAIAGAFYGPDALPPGWLRRLDPAVRDACQELAPGLLRLSPWWRVQSGVP